MALVASIGLLLLLPSVAFADNCSSLGDCWSTAAGAASAALGAAVGGIGGLFGAGGAGGAGGTTTGGGASTGGGAGGSWPAPPAAQPPTAPPGRWDHYPFAGPGEPTGEKAARQRVRDYMHDVRTGKAPRRTSEDAMRDLESVVPKLDLDEVIRKDFDDSLEKWDGLAQRG
jgi:hypothetical protein